LVDHHFTNIVNDTDVASLIQKDRTPSWVNRYLLGARVWLTFVTVGELWKWAEARSWGQHNRDELGAWISRRPVLPCDDPVARQWGALSAAARRRGHPRPQNVTWVAASCLQDTTYLEPGRCCSGPPSIELRPDPRRRTQPNGRRCDRRVITRQLTATGGARSPNASAFTKTMANSMIATRSKPTYSLSSVIVCRHPELYVGVQDCPYQRPCENPALKLSSTGVRLIEPLAC
jgi:predicted nucleic acid-binding protein